MDTGPLTPPSSPPAEDSIKKFFESKPLRLLKNMKEVIGVTVFYLTVARAPFTSPALQISYESMRLLQPFHTVAYMDSLIEQDSTRLETERRVAAPLVSDELLQIEIKNTTSERINDIDLSVHGVSRVGDISGKSSSSRVDIHDLLAKAVYRGDVLLFPALSTVPPKATITLLIWGDFDSFADSPVEAKAATKSIRVARFRRASPIASFIDANLLELASLLAVVALIVGARRYVRSGRTNA